jgi:hypothetical protein
MKSTHTPTPWLVRFDEDRFDSKLSVLEVIDGRDESLNHPQGELVLARVNVSAFAPHMDEPLANARLIAAAPELLAIVRALLPHANNEWTRLDDLAHRGNRESEDSAMELDRLIEHARETIEEITGDNE